MFGVLDLEAAKSSFPDPANSSAKMVNGNTAHTDGFANANGHIPPANGHIKGNGVNSDALYSSNGHSTNGDHCESQNGELHGDAGVEPIAIIGMGCRLPGGSSSSSKLWDLLVAGRSAQGPFPASRFNIDGFYHPNSDRPGSLNMNGGYFIDEDIRLFENSMFGINNLEATFMDPQQRKLLEVVFEACEGAGLSLEQLSGSNMGCYVGNFVTDFITMQLKDSEYTHRYTATGLGTTILANRISHVFNLKGPSFVIDTACSSSLYCLHAACSALQSGDCDSAIVAGANLIQSPEQQLATMKAGVLSKTSTCHTFDSSADGYGRADGIGALVVKRLSDAIRDGDPIRAVIRGTAVNSNGRTNGITLPSSDGQEAVIRKAYAQAGLTYNDTDYVECHGTGTAVGDPIEVEAVSRVFRRPRSESPLLIGSVKTNLGHSEAASGISSIIKVVCALEKGVIPPTIGVKNVNPKIKLEEWNIKIVTEPTSWPSSSSLTSERRIRRAGVNSFGYGGANSHAIIDAADMHVPEDYMAKSIQENITASARANMILPVSANNTTALERRVTDLASVDLSHVSTIDLAYTLGARRSHLPVRGYMLARPGHLAEDLSLDNLKTRLSGKNYSKHPLAFVFTGQGAQWPEMGRGLLAEFPLFRKIIQMLDSTLQLLPHPPTWTLLGTLLEPAETSQINDAARSQPICTAVQVGLIELLASFGIKPQRVIGHSSGEIAAAYTAGYVTAKQAIAIAYYRGYTVTRSSKVMSGAMLAAGLGREEADKTIDELGLRGKINVACVNSPESVTISGDVDGIKALKVALDAQGAFARVLKTDGKAYHSHHMAALGEEYEHHMIDAEAIVGPVSLTESTRSNSQVTWISSVTGEIAEKNIGLTYWRTNLESPVLFEDVVGKLLKDFGACHLIEIGPHSALELPIKQTRTKLIINQDNLHYNSALSRGKDSIITVLGLVGALFLHGHAITFENVNVVDSWPVKTKTGRFVQQIKGRMLPDLPKYHWDYDLKQKLFHEARTSMEWRNRKFPHHDLLGSQVHGGNGILTSWRNVLKVKDVPWIEGHKLDSTIVVPGAGYLAMAVEALSQVKNVSDSSPSDLTFKLHDIQITKALVIPQEDGLDTGVEIFTTLEPAHISKQEEADWYRFNISSYASGEATTHASGLIKLSLTSSHDKTTRLEAVKQSEAEATAPRVWYNKFADGGLNFQESFQSLSQVHVHTKRQEMGILARTELRQGGGSGMSAESKYIIHPITIDALFQAGIIASTSGVTRELTAKVPVHIEQLMLRIPPAGQSAELSKDVLNVKAISEPVGFGTIRVSGELYGDDGSVLLRVSKCRLVAYESGSQQQEDDERHPMLRVLWKPDITQMGPGSETQLSSYVEQYATRAANVEGHGAAAMIRLAAVVDLLAHKNPRLRILNFAADEKDHAYLADTLKLATSFKKCDSLWHASHAEDGTLRFQDYASEDKPSKPDFKFDLVIAGPGQIGKNLDEIDSLIAAESLLLFAGSQGECTELKELGFKIDLRSQLGGADEVMLARRSVPGQDDEGTVKHIKGEVLIVERNKTHSLNAFLAGHIETATSQPARRVTFDKITPELIQSYTNVIVTIELENPVLSCISSEDMRLVKLLTDNCTNLVWVTNGQLLQGSRPEMGIVFGLSRALMLEQPSLRFFVVDVDVDVASSPSEIDTTAVHVLDVMSQAIDASEPDFEFVHDNGVLHVSRFTPAEGLNSTFRGKQGAEKKMVAMGEAKPFRLDTEQVGRVDSIFFRQQEATAEVPVAAGHVEVEVKAIGLIDRDLQAISGNVENSKGTTCASQYSGVITAIGDDVQNYVPGDRVIVMAPGHFATLERVPASSCYKLNDDEDSATIASIPVPLSTALYALKDRAHLQADESILISYNSQTFHATAAFAAVRIAQNMGAQVFAVCNTDTSDERLPEHIFNAQDPELVAKLLRATNQQGIDVVVSFSDSQLDTAIFADCARLVQIGSHTSGLAATVASDPSVLQRHVTFTSFDMGSLIARQTSSAQSLRQRLLSEAMSLYRSGTLSDLSLTPRVFEVSDTASAFKALTHKDSDSGPSSSSIVVSLENPGSLIPAMPMKYDTQLSPEKSYLMIGCLGGLGRSMSKWMLSRGARKFVFMGRSGTDKAPARRLVENLQSLGAQVTVIRGDVVNAEDVNRAVEGVKGKIGGVIQAAMGLDEALFTTMPQDYWLAGLRPKVVGSWNLLNALSGRTQDLDFFLMTSSVSGSVGTATESNYCSANYFLDVFARYCRKIGIPGISVGLGMISEVGYLHENPEIEALLLRKGIQAINEDEMLQIIDIALSTTASTATDVTYDSMALGHVLTGLEPLGLKALRAKGFEGTSPVLGDPRAFLLSAALDESSAGSSGSNKSSNGLPSDVAEAMDAGASVEEAVLKTVSKKFSGLVLIPVDKLDVSQPISSVGVDSMLAAEFRAWIFQAFKVDVPYLTLLSPAATLTMLSEMVSNKITGEK